jgi:hypothetical protein
MVKLLMLLNSLWKMREERYPFQSTVSLYICLGTGTISLKQPSLIIVTKVVLFTIHVLHTFLTPSFHFPK